MRSFLLIPLLFLAACGPSGTTGGSPEVPVQPTPSAAGSPTAAGVDPFAVIGSLQQEQLPAKPPDEDSPRLALAKRPRGVPAAPKSCRAFVARRAAGELACKDRASALDALARALAEAGGDRRDALLVDVERCAALPKGLVRALRAELAPVECGDGLVEPVLAASKAELRGVVYDALYGLGLAGRLARTVGNPPKLKPPHDKQRVDAFHKGPLLAWSTEQAKAIQGMSDLGVKLTFYGKAVAAVEAGMADMRFVEVVRALPVPDEYANDQELLDEYHGHLEVALQPRKDRGRDAALVGLRALATVGVIDDPRVARARRLLSLMYGGRPIDALDALLLGPDDRPSPTTTNERLASTLPTFYAGVLLEPTMATEPRGLGLLAQKGVPLAHRIALRSATLGPELRLIYGRARLRLAQRYWRAVDVDEAVGLLARWPEGTSRPAAGNLLLAVGLALREGPADAAAMIRLAPLDSLGIGRVAALDALAQDGSAGPLAGLAAFNAAVVRQVAAPPKARSGYWKELAQRYRSAAKLLEQAPHQTAARERAAEADATARAIQGRKSR